MGHPGILGTGGSCGNCSIYCFVNTWLYLFRFFLQSVSLVAQLRIESVYGAGPMCTDHGCLSPVQYIHISLFLILALKATVPTLGVSPVLFWGFFKSFKPSAQSSATVATTQGQGSRCSLVFGGST